VQFIRERYNYLFRSTKGLVLVAIAMISLVTVFFGTLSGPMATWGVRDWMVNTFGLRLIEAEREGRIIMIYHTIAVAVVAIEVYLITSQVKMTEYEQATINSTMTFGYLITMVFGLWFAYFGHNFVFHGLFLFGLSLSFFAGLLLASALFPWRTQYLLPKDTPYARGPGGVSLERLSFFLMAVATLGSALFGAVSGSYWGNGHETFLAEDLIREPHKTALELAIIGHLHIMLTLIAIALTLLIGRWFDFKGWMHRAAMPCMILGTLIVTIGVWMVVPFEPIAHTIITVGSSPVLLAAAFLVVYGWRQTANLYMERHDTRPGPVTWLRALLSDPLRFGVLWQMVYMNFVVTFLGIFMAVRLDEIFRNWTLREERIALTGHWHILAGIIATIILLYYADIAGLKGKARQWFGWVVIIGSDLSFGAVALLMTKRLYVSEIAEMPLVNLVNLLSEIGLGAVVVMLGALMTWRLIDLFNRKGLWRRELASPELITTSEELE
jgi:hypothetical protein